MDKRQLWRQYGYVLNLTREFVREPLYIRKINDESIQPIDSKLQFRKKLEYYSRLCGKVLKSLSMHLQQCNYSKYPNTADPGQPNHNIKTSFNKITGLSSNWSFDGILLVVYYCWNHIHIKDQITLIHCLAKVFHDIISHNSNYRLEGNFISNLESGSPEDAIFRFINFCLTQDSSKLDTLSKLGKTAFDAINSKGNPIKIWKEVAKLTSNDKLNDESDNTLFGGTVKECKRVKDVALLIGALQLLCTCGIENRFLANPLKLCIDVLRNIINRIEGNRGRYHEFDDVFNFRDAISITNSLRLLKYECFDDFILIFDATISRYKDGIKANTVTLPLLTLLDCAQAAGACAYANVINKSMIIAIICNVKIVIHKLGYNGHSNFEELDSGCGLCPDCQNEIQQAYQGDAMQLENLSKNITGMSAFALAGKAGVLCVYCCEKINCVSDVQEEVSIKKQPISLWRSLHRHLSQLAQLSRSPDADELDRDLSLVLDKTLSRVEFIICS